MRVVCSQNHIELRKDPGEGFEVSEDILVRNNVRIFGKGRQTMLFAHGIICRPKHAFALLRVLSAVVGGAYMEVAIET